MEGPMEDSENNPFLVTGTILHDLQENNQLTDKSLRDIVSTSTNADTIRQALKLQEKAKAVAISTISWFGSLQIYGNSADVPFMICGRLAFSNKGTLIRARRKGGALDKMWTSIEVELKEKKLTDLQLHGLLQATQKSQNYASMLNRGILGLEDVITSNKYKSEQINSPHKPLLTKETMANLAPTILPGLKSLISNLEVQHEDIVEEIKRHSCD
ncbi:6100_t:CDS:2 [Funneliformis caledonium]|uniref:6100_t:CDS:1 n=1 Tax=Funneliformis caledonium TaxID=1117310 RepID=A0A9N9N603_9GLOM|nr:6100_t:CDS:2 [Funneliformis caledonium]